MVRIDVDRIKIFGNSTSPDREADVCFASPSSAPRASVAAARARALGVAQALCGDEQRRGSPDSHNRRRFGTLRDDVDWCGWAPLRRTPAHGDDGARRRPVTVTRAAAKDAHGTSNDVYDWSLEDEQSDCEGNRFCLKLPPIQKYKYGPLPLNTLKSQARGGKINPISVDKMYSSQPSSTSLSAKRTHAIDPEVSDHEKCQEIESPLTRRFSKRRKEQHQNTSSVHSRKRTPIPPSSTQMSAEDSECRCGKKQKNRSASPNNGFHERYLKLKREEIDRFAAIEEKKLKDPYSINKCITVLEGLNGLQMGDILVAADIFKTKENREIFLSFSSDALRLAWITRKIGRD